MIVDELRIVGSTQTNVVMAAELTRIAQRAIGRRPPKPAQGGPRPARLSVRSRPRVGRGDVPAHADPRAVGRLPLARDAARAAVRRAVADLRDDARALWRDGDGISVEARRVEAFAAGERQIVGTVKNALVDAARRGAARGCTSIRIGRRRAGSRGSTTAASSSISIDLGGGSLSQRGWRREAGEAPLREHLAAVLLMLARFDPRADVLVDPMCGAGTIPIEAVLAARATPRADARARGARPRAARRRRGRCSPTPLRWSIGCDLDLEVLAAARDNARAAGVADAITLAARRRRALRPEMIADIARERGRDARRRACCSSNPPYGERLDEHDLASTLRGARRTTCRRFRGWRAGFLVGNPLLEEVFVRVDRPAADQEAAREREPARVLLPLRAVTLLVARGPRRDQLEVVDDPRVVVAPDVGDHHHRAARELRRQVDRVVARAGAVLDLADEIERLLRDRAEQLAARAVRRCRTAWSCGRRRGSATGARGPRGHLGADADRHRGVAVEVDVGDARRGCRRAVRRPASR